jgi:hypothetical protein
MTRRVPRTCDRLQRVTTERREGDRYQAWFPVQFTAGALRDHLAISRDVSSRGMQLSAATDLEPGSRVTVSFRVMPDDSKVRSVEGKVVRVEDNTDDPDGLWPLRVAVEFDEPIPDLERQLADAADSKRGI